MAHFKISATVPYGGALRVGYRIRSSDDPWIYLTHQPSYDEIPYTFAENVPPGDYELEVSGVCVGCNGPKYSTPQIIYQTVF